MEAPDIKQIEEDIDTLIQICESLREENYTLRQTHAHALAERDRYKERGQQVQSKLETLLVRLKAIEG